MHCSLSWCRDYSNGNTHNIFMWTPITLMTYVMTCEDSQWSDMWWIYKVNSWSPYKYILCVYLSIVGYFKTTSSYVITHHWCYGCPHKHICVYIFILCTFTMKWGQCIKLWKKREDSKCSIYFHLFLLKFLLQEKEYVCMYILGH